jgi:hypothetical protein
MSNGAGHGDMLAEIQATPPLGCLIGGRRMSARRKDANRSLG